MFEWKSDGQTHGLCDGRNRILGVVHSRALLSIVAGGWPIDKHWRACVDSYTCYFAEDELERAKAWVELTLTQLTNTRAKES